MTSGRPWLFSPAVDLASFAAPALFSLAVVSLAPRYWPDGESPEWLWVAGVLLVDVAHVWSSAFVTYLDPAELSRHRARYVLVPALGWVGGVGLYALGGAASFWRVLAYVAVFHFVRQQYGFLALYRARAREHSRLGAFIDGAAIYAATLYPLLYWHTHLPRRFAWFMQGDFGEGAPLVLEQIGAAVHAAALGAYAGYALFTYRRGRPTPWGKHLLVGATAATWYGGIVVTNSDLAFTVTNVFAHGIPYAVLVFSYGRHLGADNDDGRSASPRALLLGGTLWSSALRFAACLWSLAFVEELLWDRSLWHERDSWFALGRFDVSSFESLWVPLLAVPQWTHYVLDGLFWRRGDNPSLGRWLRRSI
jgi:hypothetical protein